MLQARAESFRFRPVFSTALPLSEFSLRLHKLNSCSASILAAGASGAEDAGKWLNSQSRSPADIYPETPAAFGALTRPKNIYTTS